MHFLNSVPNAFSRRSRSGLSIMEVLFAIAVLTIGLLGVAHILPVATNNAAHALKIDRAVEEISNRVARDVARLRSSFESVIVAENSLDRFNNTPATARSRFIEMNSQTFAVRRNQYQYPPNVALLPGGQPQLPDAFCIDPWFISATNNLRDDTDNTNPDNGRNGYDRTMFPCFDPRYHPINFPPSDSMALSSPLQWDGPRFTRVQIPFEGSAGILSPLGAEVSTLTSDGLSLVKPDDSTRPTGIFVQRSSNGGGSGTNSLSRNTVSSRYSSIVMMSRSQAGSNLFDAAVATMEDRQVVTVRGGGPALAHQLQPHAIVDPSVANQPPPADNEILYPGEQLGYVTYSNQPFIGGGGGEFVFRTNRFVKPDIGDGDWLMLMRREYARVPDPPAGSGNPPPVPPQIAPGKLHFSWYRVSDVTVEPELFTDSNGLVSYQTQVAVRGPDWIFHPIQTQPFAGTYGAPYFGNSAQPTWGPANAFPIYNYDNMAPRGTDPPPSGSAPLSPIYEHQDYGTFVVIMPDVISIKQFQVQF